MGTTEISTTKFGSTDVYNSFKYLIALNNSNATENIPSDILDMGGSNYTQQGYYQPLYVDGNLYKYLPAPTNSYMTSASKYYVYRLGKNDTKWTKINMIDRSSINKKIWLRNVQSRFDKVLPCGQNNNCLFNNKRIAFLVGGCPKIGKRYEHWGMKAFINHLDTDTINPFKIEFFDPETFTKTEKSVTLTGFPSGMIIRDQNDSYMESPIHLIYYDKFSQRTYAIISAYASYRFELYQRYNSYYSRYELDGKELGVIKIYLAYFRNETANNVELVYDREISSRNFDTTANSSNRTNAIDPLSNVTKLITTKPKDYDFILLKYNTPGNSSSDQYPLISLKFSSSGVKVGKSNTHYTDALSASWRFLLYDDYYKRLICIKDRYISHYRTVENLDTDNNIASLISSYSGWTEYSSTIISLFGYDKITGTGQSTSATYTSLPYVYFGPYGGIFDNIFDNKDNCIMLGPAVYNDSGKWINNNKCVNIKLDSDGKFKEATYN